MFGEVDVVSQLEVLAQVVGGVFHLVGEIRQLLCCFDDVRVSSGSRTAGIGSGFICVPITGLRPSGWGCEGEEDCYYC